MSAPDSLQRFLDAQATVYSAALAELRAGQKRGHWMWFVFPQLKGLGHSETAQYYGLSSAVEASSYAAHLVLGARLRECTEATLGVPKKTAHDIFGSPDDLKLRSCLTLFNVVALDSPLYERALERFFPEGPDPKTLRLLDDARPHS